MKRTPLHAQCLPAAFLDWFAARGWTPRGHQLELVAQAEAGESALLVAPTGAGKTLAGFLPSLVELTSRARHKPGTKRRGLHTLYISPLKALAIDVARNLKTPVEEMGLPIRIETRTGDTSPSKRQRQRRDPPDMLLTTPEQLALLLASPDAQFLFGDLQRVVLDELHALVTSKRGDLLSLGLARLRSLAPQMTVIGLSATVRDPDDLRRWLVGSGKLAALVTAPPGAQPDLRVLDTSERLPWAGHSAVHALREIYDAIRAANMTLVFVNTRAQAEFVFQELWRMNDDALAIALHHGSLDAGQRRRVEEAMAAGRLKAVVCTSTLDLGIDWGAVDLVINVGAPKGSSRLMQRIGRANHRLDEPSRAILVPANRFEVLECVAAVDAAREGAQDTAQPRTGALDVLAQHILGMACAEPFAADALYNEIVSAAPYADLAWEQFEKAVDFVATGGYALRTYDRFAKIKRMPDGRWRVANGRIAQAYRMNVGTIIEADMLKVRMLRGPLPKREPGAVYTGKIGRGGRVLGEIEESFIEMLTPNDTFVFGGEILALQGIQENEALVSRTHADAPKVPSYAGGKFPLSTYLASRVRGLLADPASWDHLPPQVGEWLALQAERSVLPGQRDLLVETFPRGGRFYMAAYPFEGRLAHQTLGMLLTRRMDRAGLKPLGFVANDYALAVWSLADVGRRVESGEVSLGNLFSQEMLGDDLEEWMHESALMKRTFRNCAVIAGLIERRFPGKEKTGRQVTISTDLVYDVLRRHEPDHLLLEAARQDAATGLLDIARLSDMLARIAGRIVHRDLDRVSPLAVPIMLEIGRELVYGEAQDQILAEAANDLIREAQGAKARGIEARDLVPS
ncbi:MAG: ATP-dependent helicase Lhr and Lhr-like helicase [Methylobacteriaceae bacterium]|nr:ATP-dependent helicase Lhr and Lhr-like helicase [Methylobacteriaceae bacterium]